MLEQYHDPYLFIDHLKMGLIRSGNTGLTPWMTTSRRTKLEGICQEGKMRFLMGGDLGFRWDGSRRVSEFDEIKKSDAEVLSIAFSVQEW